MVEGLVISENIVLFEEFNINFSDEKNNVDYAHSSAAAKDLIAMEMPDYIVLVEESAGKAMALLKELNEEEGVEKIPVLCMLPASQWKNRNMLWEMGVKDVIPLPILKEEMKFQLERFLHTIEDISIDYKEAGMHGKLEDYSLLDLIQILASNKKTGILNLYRSREEGKIVIQDGNIQNATYRSFEPLQAAALAFIPHPSPACALATHRASETTETYPITLIPFVAFIVRSPFALYELPTARAVNQNPVPVSRKPQ